MIGLSIVHAEFLRDNTKNVVLDTTTNLMWQDDITPEPMNWGSAITYCENLELGNFSDWRLPNKNELKSIVDRSSVVSPAISSVFQTVFDLGDYQSSTTSAVYTNQVWLVSFLDGKDSFGTKGNTYVRCVR